MSLKEYMLQQHLHSDGRHELSLEQSSPLPAYFDEDGGVLLSVAARQQRAATGSREEEVAGAEEEEDLLAIEERTIENDELTARSQYRRSPGMEEEKKQRSGTGVPGRAESVEVAVKAYEERQETQPAAASRGVRDQKIDVSIDKISG